MPMVLFLPPYTAVIIYVYIYNFFFSFLEEFKAVEDETFFLAVIYAFLTKGFFKVPERIFAHGTVLVGNIHFSALLHPLQVL